MARSIEELDEIKKYKDHALSTLCWMIPSSAFYATLRNLSFNKIASRPLVLIIFIHAWW